MPDRPWLSIVGIGEDGMDGLSIQAKAAIEGAVLVVGGRRHLALAAPLVKARSLAWQSPIEATFPAILDQRPHPVCVLATGDPFFYGIGATLAGQVSAAEMSCFPQPSAFSLAAARLGWPLQDCLCVSLHGRALGRIIPHLQPRLRILALSWDHTTPRYLADLLVARGFGPTHLTIGEALGGPRERMRTARAEAFDLADILDLNIVALEIDAGPEARVRPLTPGLPDDWFEHDGQITKAPIRALTLSALAPTPGATLWDLGAGSGSVSIEWLLAHDATRAIAVERDAARVARIGRNAEYWGVADRITIIEGRLPEAMPQSPPPDAIFIGGGLTAPGLIEAAMGTLRPGGRLVANAVTLESQALLSRQYGAAGGDLMTVAIAHAEPVGAFHGLRPAMSIMQWCWCKS